MFLRARIRLARSGLTSVVGALAPGARRQRDASAGPASFARQPAAQAPARPDPVTGDDATIRAEVVAFLDRVEARELGRAKWSAEPTRPSFTTDAIDQQDWQTERATTARVTDAEREAAHVLEAARREASELVCEARGEAEQMLEWSRAQAAEIVRRSQHVAADRFGQQSRPWLAAEPTST